MKYLIKGEVAFKIGDGILFPNLCDFHVGAILTDESMALFATQVDPQHRLAAGTPQQALPPVTQPNSWLKDL